MIMLLDSVPTNEKVGSEGVLQPRGSRRVQEISVVQLVAGDMVAGFQVCAQRLSTSGFSTFDLGRAISGDQFAV